MSFQVFFFSKIREYRIKISFSCSELLFIMEVVSSNLCGTAVALHKGFTKIINDQLDILNCPWLVLLVLSDTKTLVSACIHLMR